MEWYLWLSLLIPATTGVLMLCVLWRCRGGPPAPVERVTCDRIPTHIQRLPAYGPRYHVVLYSHDQDATETYIARFDNYETAKLLAAGVSRDRPRAVVTVERAVAVEVLRMRAGEPVTTLDLADKEYRNDQPHRMV